MSALAVEQRPLQERTDAALARAAALLAEPSSSCTDLPGVVRLLQGRLSELGVESERVREQLAARDRLHERYALRFRALADVHGAVDRLRELTAPQ
ncbi:MAG TPA: hypothetical protein VFW09_18785, partial [Solirubrobacteraceae bacterium]|nr:hypothetical protein [Solirubrobacteraceae bacterium]